jgi:tyrosyl-tRNA synthetase
MFGKTLRIPDNLIYTYFELASDVSNRELSDIKRQLEDPKLNPRDLKRKLARTIVTMYYSSEEAQSAEAEFDRIFIDKEAPDVIEEFVLRSGDTETTMVGLLALSKLASSKSEARRLIEQGGLSIDGERVTDLNAGIPHAKEFVVKVGKRKFLKIVREQS